MELALMLIVFVLLEMALSVWAFVSVKAQRREISDLRSTVMMLADMVRGGDPLAPLPSHEPSTLPELLKTATPDDVEKANAVLKALGVKVD